MNTSEIKKSLHNYIEMIEDESQLQMLNDISQQFLMK
jgi:hypothetical protein